ncbi:hypothetical protein CsatA_000964 [Cannabis sativa]
MADRRNPRRRILSPTMSIRRDYNDMISVLTDDLFLKILTQIPDYRSVMQCSLVCKRWSSLISGSQCYLSRLFNKQDHQDHKSKPKPKPNPVSLLLRYADHSPSKILHGKRHPCPWLSPSCKSNYLNFLNFKRSERWENKREPKPIVRSTYRDLLLLQKTPTKFCICNPITEQCVSLPESPSYEECRVGFVCMPKSCCQLGEIEGFNDSYCSMEYRVVLFDVEKVCIAVFSSETGEWKESILSIKFPSQFRDVWLDWGSTSVACSNGKLYWLLEFACEAIGVVALDVLMTDPTQQCRFIGLPKGFLKASQRVGIRRVGVLAMASVIGMVRGRLRLCQSYWYGNELSKIHLKSWDLKMNNYDHNEEDDHGWVLVHDVVVQNCEERKLYVIGYHPDPDDDRGDMFFFLGQDLVDYKSTLYKSQIGRDISLEKIRSTASNIPFSSLQVFSLVHPWLPTRITASP